MSVYPISTATRRAWNLFSRVRVLRLRHLSPQSFSCRGGTRQTRHAALLHVRDTVSHLHGDVWLRFGPPYSQNRFYADTGYDREIRQFCKANGIDYQSFWTLTASQSGCRSFIASTYPDNLPFCPADPSILSSRAIRTAASRLQAMPEQVFYGFCIREGIVPLNGTTNKDRMRLGVQVMNGQIGQLSTEEASAIRKLLQ